MSTTTISHDIDLTDILDGIALNVDFTVDLTERSADDEGYVDITLRYPDATRVMIEYAVDKFRKALWSEIARLKDGDELVEAARTQLEDTDGE